MYKSKKGIGLTVIVIFLIILSVVIFSIAKLLLKAVNMDNSYVFDEMVGNVYQNENVTDIYIDVAATQLTLEEGEILTFKTNNKYIESNLENNILKVVEKSHSVISLEENTSKVIVTLPKGYEISTLNMNIGAGETVINKINITKSATINAGAGSLVINSGRINDLKLSLGTGKAEITSVLTGKSKIEAGVGKLDLTLLGGKENYTINAEKGIGSINIYGTNNSEKFGSGGNIVDITGGIGSIEVDFK